MDQRYLKYYDRYSSLASLRFAWDAFWEKSPRRVIALRNRQRDYLRLAGDETLLRLHRSLNGHLLESARNWSSYDYGEGYFYQGLRQIGITGLRDTQARAERMDLASILSDRSVLEIGCNSGFVSILCAATAQRVVGFDVNPHLVAIANDTATHLECRNVSFIDKAFEDYSSNELFDAVLSFANHSTYDGNTRQSLEAYFERCHALTRPGGLLLFESHPPSHEGEGLPSVLRLIEHRYSIQQVDVLEYGSFLDTGRTYVVARRT